MPSIEIEVVSYIAKKISFAAKIKDWTALKWRISHARKDSQLYETFL
jgi:hypothetical protein